ncbi:MAG: M17 family metallopeptidase [Comamonadaceae bacterium]|nr:M17 family metallopeptidase [Comamonadaceae bacterium]
MGPAALAEAALHDGARHGMRARRDRRRGAAEGRLPGRSTPWAAPPTRRAAADRAAPGATPTHPKLTLVGKGVCFDTGGLDIKPRRRHAADEEGHGRRGQRAGRWRSWSMALKLPVRLHAADPGGGERHRRQRLPPGRRDHARAQGLHDRDRQHRRRGPRRSSCDALAYARRGQARPADRPGHADRRRARGARPAAAGAVLPRRRRLARELRRPRPGACTTRCGTCRCGSDYHARHRERHRRPRQHRPRRDGRRDQRGAVPRRSFVRRGAALAAPRPVRLEPEAARPAARSAREAQCLRALYALIAARFAPPSRRRRPR